MRKFTLFFMSLFLAVGAMAQEEPAIVGVKNIPTEKVDLSQGLQTGYYLLKQVNDNAGSAGGQGVGYIKAADEAAGASATSKNTGEPQMNGVTYVWYVDVVNAESNLITISTANKVAAWQAPHQHQKNLVAYADKATLKYHTGTVNLSGDATPKDGSCFISNEGTTAFVHFSGDNLGSWTDTNQASMFMVEFYKLSEDDLAYYGERYDYVHNTGNMNRNDRGLTSFTITDGTNSLEVTDIQTSSTAPVYVDKSAQKFTTTAGATLSFSAFNYTGSWMHAYAYVDYNNDWYFTLEDNNDGTNDGEVVSYNYYGGNTITGASQNQGNAMSSVYDGSKTLPAFTLPANLEPGEYRMRIKVDWDNKDADYGASDIAANGGCQCDITIVVVPSYELSVGQAGWATLYLDFNAAIPADVEAYTVTEIKNGYVTLTEVEGVLPANTGVLVNAAQGNYTFNYAAEATANVEDNLLEGTVAATEISAEAYVLSIVNGNVGLYKAQMAGGVWLNNANKAYLPASVASGAASYSFRFGEGTTGIENVEVENVDVIYDLTGRQVNAVERGIYIINGKKVLVK